MTGISELGTLEVVSPRHVWPGEATHFTPWLLEHANYLADALGIDLELEEAEHAVGGFSLDLIGRDLSNDAVLIVENQLEATDHRHLGQLMTYAAGVDATTIVWIATDFREEHRQAIDWLNQVTGSDTHFFGIRLQVVRIGESAPAPLLEVIAKPNDWQKQVRAAADVARVGEKGQLYIQFWARFLERVREEHPGWTASRTPQPSNWHDQPSQVPGAHFSVSFAAGGQLRSMLYLGDDTADENLRRFHLLLDQRDPLEAAFGGPLDFEEAPGRKYCAIGVDRDGDVMKTTEHEAYIDWLFEMGQRLRDAVAAVQLT